MIFKSLIGGCDGRAVGIPWGINSIEVNLNIVAALTCGIINYGGSGTTDQTFSRSDLAGFANFASDCVCFDSTSGLTGNYQQVQYTEPFPGSFVNLDGSINQISFNVQLTNVFDGSGNCIITLEVEGAADTGAGVGAYFFDTTVNTDFSSLFGVHTITGTVPGDCSNPNGTGATFTFIITIT